MRLTDTSMELESFDHFRGALAENAWVIFPMIVARSVVAGVVGERTFLMILYVQSHCT